MIDVKDFSFGQNKTITVIIMDSDSSNKITYSLHKYLGLWLVLEDYCSSLNVGRYQIRFVDENDITIDGALSPSQCVYKRNTIIIKARKFEEY